MHEALGFLLIIGVWFFIQTWLLPRFGVKT
jgi:hypothetical protein